MKKRALNKDFHMEITKSMNRFLSILLIVALGVAFFAGIQSAAPDMRVTEDAYFDDSNLMDIRVMGTYGLTEDDLNAIRKVDGVERAAGAYMEDVYSGDEESQDVLHVESFTDSMNEVAVTEGELPAGPGECLLDSYYAEKAGYQPGDVLEFQVRDEDDTTLLRREFTIAGLGYSPTYIAFTRGSTTLGTGSLDGFVYVLPEEFDTDIYGVAYVQAEGAKEELAYTDAYDDTVSEVLDGIEEIGDVRCGIRYEEVTGEAESEMEQAKADVADGKEELADAEAELEDARAQWEEGESEYRDGRAELEENADLLEEAGEQLADAETQLNDGEEDYHDGLIKFLQEGLSGMQELHLVSSRISSGRAEADEGWAEYESGAAEAASGEAELADARQQLYDAQAQYDAGAAQLTEGQNTYNASAAQVEEGRAALEAAQEELASGQSEYDAGRADLDEGWAEYNASLAELAAGWAEYDANEAAVEAGLEEYNTALAQVEELRAGTQEAEAGVNSLQEALAAAQAASDAAGNAAADAESEYNSAVAYRDSLDPDSEEYAAAQAAVEAAEGVLAAARAAADEAAGQVSALTEQFEAAQAAASEWESALAAAQAALDAQADQIAALAAAQEELAAARAKLEAGQMALDTALAELNANEEALADAKAQLDAGAAEIAENERTLAEGEAQLASGWDEIVSGQAQLDAAAAQISSGWSEVYAGEAELEEGNTQLTDALTQLNDAEEQLASAQSEVDAGYEELYSAYRELTDARQELDDGWEEYRSSYREYKDGLKEFRDGRKELRDARAELKSGKKEIEDGEQEIEDARAEIANGEQKIADGEKELDELSVPSWYVNDRSVLPDNTGYGENADRMTSIATVFPFLFFLVAALISLTTMTRMVEEERTQIGTLKALGYGKYDIAKKYLKYALWATVLGSLLGILGGEKVLPWVIIEAYGIMYQYQPAILLPYHWGFGLIAAGMALVSTIGATLWACCRSLGSVPAELMRPPAPKQGKRVFLERIPFIWNRLNFNWKSTVRNLMRYKSRCLMTILGIGGCMGLLLVGYGLRDSIMDVVLLQYDQLQTYDAMLILDTDASAEEIAGVEAAIEDDSRITDSSYFYMQSLDIAQPDAKGSGKEWSIYLYVPKETDGVGDFLIFRDRKSKEEYSLTDAGAIITEKITKEFGLSPGDTIAISDDDQGIVEVPIADICENYLSHYLYLTPQLYEELFGEAPEFNSIFFSTDQDQEVLEEIGSSLLSLDACLSISYTYELRKQVEDMLSALDLVILVLIVSAGLLAFVVLYNLNNININERTRELATLKVLGFHDIEVANYVYRENILLTILGAAAGCVIGRIMHAFIITTVEVDSTMFGRSIYPKSYILGTLFTFAFSIIVNFAMYFKLKKIDMIESLKSVE